MKLVNERGEFRLTPTKVSRRALLATDAWLRAVRFGVRNLFFRASVVDPLTDVIVSLTTYGRRLDRVYLPIESIAAGTRRPRRLILWVDREALAHALSSRPLARLRRRGLEIRSAESALQAHKKYIHVVEGEDWGAARLVLADDDIFYPKRWLESLIVSSSTVGDNCIVSHWTKTYSVIDQKLCPYLYWSDTREMRNDRTQFFLGGSGTLLPLSVLAALRERGRGFKGIADSADDIWLNWVARRAGATVRQVGQNSIRLRSVPMTQSSKLSTGNSIGGGNDKQISALFSSADVAEIVTSIVRLADS